MTTSNPKAVLKPNHPFRNGGATAVEIFKAMKPYALNDACERSDKDIYVLESPHLHEMMYRRMLAGDSGVAFSQCLSGNNDIKVPFGLFGVAPWDPKPRSLQGIGAINACSFPMQADTYGPARSSLPGLDRAVIALRRLRDRPEGKRNDVWDREFEKLIVEALVERVRPLDSARVMFYPCGKVARGLLNRARSLIRNAKFQTWPNELPHPSYNAWQGLSASQLRREGGTQNGR